MRHEKFSSIGKDLTEEIKNHKTYKTSRKINSIAVHCSATPYNKDFDVYDIDRWHQQRWGSTSGVGYHYIIKRDGTIQKGRWVDYPGAHVKGYNRDTIGICYIGGLDENNKAINDKLTPKQEDSLIALLQTLKELYDLPSDKILGHKEYPGVNKACPCLTMDDIRAEL